MRYLYLIERTDDVGFDEYDSAVVCARNEDEAKTTDMGYGGHLTHCLKNIDVKLLGPADSNVELGVVCSSFNAG